MNLQEIFASRYNEEAWKKVLQTYFKVNTLVKPKNFGDDKKPCYYMGEEMSEDGQKIGFFYEPIPAGQTANRRVGLRNLASKLAERYDLDAAVVAFSDKEHWRVSLVSNIRGFDDKDHSLPPTRYTFVFGDATTNYKTAVERFSLLENANLNYETLKEAFSVEALSNEFFEKYKKHYEDFVEYLTGIRYEKTAKGYVPIKKHDPDKQFNQFKKLAKNNTEEAQKLVRDYIKKMMGRLVFLHFLQKKGWLGAENKNWNGDKKFFLNLYKSSNAKEQNDFLDSVLEPLFCGMLNTPEKERRKKFEKEGWNPDLLKRFKEVPYLNGGLFERDYLDELKIKFPKKGSNDTVKTDFKELFEFFAEYNFTVDENAPNDMEVGVDPEMLGKIFENLLEDNNAKGAFYTPREIVTYMCKESLKVYLKGALPQIKPQTIDEFVETHELPSDEDNKPNQAALMEALRNVKICDPAIGSGAFPMGLLNELFALRQAIEGSSNHTLKKEIIQNNIYGVDIEKGAVDIARLRFWLSLVVDAQTPEALPNLDYKIMEGNSLIDTFDGYPLGAALGKLSYNAQGNELKKHLDKLHNLQVDFFKTNGEEKEKAELDIKSKLLEIIEIIFKSKKNTLLQNNEGKNDLFGEQKKKVNYKDELKIYEEKLAVVKEYRQKLKENITTPIPFFNWQIMCSDVFISAQEGKKAEGGFDIVIGNPPYVSTKGVTTSDKKMYEAEFGFSDDTYNLFTHKGLQLAKEGGTLNFIIPKTFWTTQTKRGMRDLILSKKINYIFDTANPFESAMVDTCVIQIQNSPFEKTHKIQFRDGSENLKTPVIFPPLEQSVYLNTQNSVIFKPTELNLKIYAQYGEKVKALYDAWWEKIKTSKDIEKNKAALEDYRKNLKPGDVALLGCLTEGGQGLATANNGKYIAVRKSTKWAQNIIESRPKKLFDALKKNAKISVKGLPGPASLSLCKEFLAKKSEKEIAALFDTLKENYGRDIFGQGYLYRLIDDDEMADVETLTKDEKENGIAKTKPHFVPYDKGDKDGNRWYLETPFAIEWTQENVRFLKTNSGKKGEGMPVVRNPQFYFREGFCWNNVLLPTLEESMYIKCRYKGKSINDVASMSLYSITSIPIFYYIILLGSSYFYNYLKTFINTTVNLQINDFRLFPIIVPDETLLDYCKKKFDRIMELKKSVAQGKATDSEIEAELSKIERELDEFVAKLYGV